MMCDGHGFRADSPTRAQVLASCYVRMVFLRNGVLTKPPPRIVAAIEVRSRHEQSRLVANVTEPCARRRRGARTRRS